MINSLGAKTGLYVEVVLTSLMTEAFHADVMSSMIVMGGWDRTDLPTEVDDWICHSHASGEKEDLWLLNIAQGPRTGCTVSSLGGVTLKVFQLCHHG